MSWTTPVPYNTHRVLRFRRQFEEVEAAARLRRILAESSSDATPLATVTKRVNRAVAGGDARRLRGIPAIGPSVSAEITGTRPDRVVVNRRDDTS